MTAPSQKVGGAVCSACNDSLGRYWWLPAAQPELAGSEHVVVSSADDSHGRLLASWTPAAAAGGDERTTSLYDASLGGAGGAPRSERSAAGTNGIAGSSAGAAAAPMSASLYQDVLLSGHSAAVTTCCWYPSDCGIFLTGGMDSRVVAWDTASFLPAYAWATEGAVYCVDMHPSCSATGACRSLRVTTRCGPWARCVAKGARHAHLTQPCQGGSAMCAR
jgi:WD40 repeat protein